MDVKTFIFLWATKLQVCRCAANCKCLCAVDVFAQVCTRIPLCVCLCVSYCFVSERWMGMNFLVALTGEAPAVVCVFFSSALET